MSIMLSFCHVSETPSFNPRRTYQHLDFETTEALIEAINKFPGGVLLVSHDQHLLTSVCKELYVVDKGGLHLLPGIDTMDAFHQYKRDVIAGRR